MRNLYGSEDSKKVHVRHFERLNKSKSSASNQDIQRRTPSNTIDPIIEGDKNCTPSKLIKPKQK